MKSIESLKKRLKAGNILTTQNENGFINDVEFEWKNPATNDDIEKFETNNKIILPCKFKEFLRISNGATLFKDVEYGQWGCKVLGLEEIMEVTALVKGQGCELKADWIVFATWFGDTDVLVFDLSKKDFKDYILDGERCEAIEDWVNIKGNFEKWLDRLIVSQGAKYWRWY